MLHLTVRTDAVGGPRTSVQATVSPVHAITRRSHPQPGSAAGDHLDAAVVGYTGDRHRRLPHYRFRVGRGVLRSALRWPNPSPFRLKRRSWPPAPNSAVRCFAPSHSGSSGPQPATSGLPLTERPQFCSSARETPHRQTRRRRRPRRTARQPWRYSRARQRVLRAPQPGELNAAGVDNPTTRGTPHLTRWQTGRRPLSHADLWSEPRYGGGRSRHGAEP